MVLNTKLARPKAPLTAIKTTEADLRRNASVEIVDQLLLPHEIRYERVDSVEGAWQAIKSMKIRGAPAIASLAALGIACELIKRQLNKDTNLNVQAFVPESCRYLLTSRPTAVNLRQALERIEYVTGQSSEDLLASVVDECISVWTDDIERNYHIGDNGASWLLQCLEAEGTIASGEKINVLTVCNTGALATSEYGTALGVITSLNLMGRLNHAYFAQTAPYMQGARLTSVELQTAQIPCTMVPDVAIAALLQGKAAHKVHAFIAGADRITANGDTANKISTFQIATLCKAIPEASHIKALVCAPLTTLDLRMNTGEEIVIEQRPAIEACLVSGKRHSVTAKSTSEALVTVLITPNNTQAFNPAFDVTPARLIDGISTEIGVATKAKDSPNDFELRKFVKSAAKLT